MCVSVCVRVSLFMTCTSRHQRRALRFSAAKVNYLDWDSGGVTDEGSEVEGWP